ncbi:MAG: hypothetical protein SFU25_00385 [Candidatus Caenarcaniphilales bacterium]|nr:hypothetical protein [Candidatus Caenarcaniphilales bacterium]
MKLFQQSYKWLNSTNCKRIRLTFSSDLGESALLVSLTPNRLTEFDSLFCLDINRDSSPSLVHSLSSQVESFIFQPSSWHEVIQSVQEVNEFAQIKCQEGKLFSGTTFVLNDWQSLQYLYSASRRFMGPNPSELLLQLKFMSDRMNLILLNNLGYSFDVGFQSSKDDFCSEDTLFNWSQASLRMQDKYSLLIEKSAIPSWKVGEKINLLTNISANFPPSFSASFSSNSAASPFSSQSNNNQNTEFFNNNIGAKDAENNPLNFQNQTLIQAPEDQQTKKFFEENLVTRELINSSIKPNNFNILADTTKPLADILEAPLEEVVEPEAVLLPFPTQNRNKNENRMQTVKSEHYDVLVTKLSEALTRQELLSARKEIQAKSTVLGPAEKAALSDIYKVNLQRIKLLEDNFQSLSLG